MIKKISITIIFLSFIMNPSSASAQLAVVETGAVAFSTAANTTQSVWQVTSETTLKPLVRTLVKSIATKITQSAISWALSGFEGEPGLINNWEFFLKDVQEKSLTGVLGGAVAVSNRIQQNAILSCNEVLGSIENYCVNTYEQDYSDCVSGYDAVEDFQQIIECQEIRDIDESDYNSCLVEYDSKQQECQETGSFAGFAGVLAEQQYNAMQSGKLADSRLRTKTILEYGSNRLNNNSVEQILNSEGETLTAVLGSADARRRFNNGETSVSVLEGIVAQALNPQNSNIGIISSTQASLQNSTDEDTRLTLENLQTPQKFLDKKKCLEYKLNEATGKQDCVRSVIQTPGQQVSSEVTNSLNSGRQQLEFTDELVGILIESLGDLTAGLIDGGLATVSSAAVSQVSNAVNSQFNSPTTGNNGFQFGGTQESYDVLGTSNDGFQDNSGPNTSINIGVAQENQANSSFIGGPEDAASFGSGPQVTVNLQDRLQSNIILAQEEQSYFEQIRLLRNATKNTLVNLDQCLLGPDYKWAQRFADMFPRSGASEEGQLNTLAYSKTREMVNDPKVNMPGAEDIRNTVESIIEGSQQETLISKQRTSALRNTLSTLNFIKGEILTDFNTQKISLSQNLVLFEQDWLDLNPTQQQEVFTKAVENNFYVLKENQTIAGVISSQNNVAQQAVVNMAWDLWRSSTNSEKKSELRYAYYVIQNDLSNDQFINQVKTKYNRLQTDAIQSEKLLRDCLVFKSYSLGKSINEINNIVSSGNNESLSQIQLQTNNLLTQSLTLGSITNNISNLSSGGINFIDSSNARTDSQIIDFLENQYQLQINGQLSLFNTKSITGGISDSILGFNSETEKQEYFEALYPDDQFPYEINKNKLSIKEMLKYDRFYAYYNRARGLRGVLFCQHQGSFEIQNSPGGGDIDGSVCLQDWYTASNLDYEVAFAGI